jgi:uncharacterized protein YkwD
MKGEIKMKLIYTFLILFSVQLFAQIPYTDLTNDIAWSGGKAGVADIASAFSDARTGENTQLTTSLSPLVMPSQATWDGMSSSEKALYLINAERVVRGLVPLEGVSNNIVTIAQTYAQWLLDNGKFGHTENNSTPSSRLNGDGQINGCSEQGFVYGPENIWNYGGSSPAPPSLPVESAVYGWIYEDKDQTWGHRRACFALFNDNHPGGSANGSEGFIGVGLAIGSYSYYGAGFPYGAVVVYDFVDPCETSALPVELTTFTANLTDNKAELNWETATEVNNYGFEIERQNAELKSQNSVWEKIGFVEGHGNSNSPKYYSFIDNSVDISGKYLYRLKQIDIDGKFEYSPETEVNFGTPKKYELNQNYPNPFNPITTINYSLPTDGFLTLNIYDVLGREIAVLENGYQKAGNYTSSFDGSKLTSGIYLYTIKAGNFTSTKKMLLMK